MPRIFLLVVLGLAIPHPHALAQDIPLEECEIAGVLGVAQCGVYHVYENRGTQEGRRIGLNVVVLPATGPNPRPDPIVVLVGGPGQAATLSAAIFSAALAPLRGDRDLVLLDQRGTGGSSALCSCVVSSRQLPCVTFRHQPMANPAGCLPSRPSGPP